MVSTTGGVNRILSQFFPSKMDVDDSSDDEDGVAAVHPMGTDAEDDDQVDWNLFGGRVNSHADWQLISLILPTPNAVVPGSLACTSGSNRLSMKGKGRSSMKAEGNPYRLDGRKAKSTRSVRFHGSIRDLDRQRTSSIRGPPSRALSKSLDSLTSITSSTAGEPSSRRSSAGKPSMAAESVQQFSAREIRSFEENVVVLRCATAIVFPPKRRQCLAKMKDLFEPGEFHLLVRYEKLAVVSQR